MQKNMLLSLAVLMVGGMMVQPCYAAKGKRSNRKKLTRHQAKAHNNGRKAARKRGNQGNEGRPKTPVDQVLKMLKKQETVPKASQLGGPAQQS